MVGLMAVGATDLFMEHDMNDVKRWTHPLRTEYQIARKLRKLNLFTRLKPLHDSLRNCHHGRIRGEYEVELGDSLAAYLRDEVP